MKDVIAVDFDRVIHSDISCDYGTKLAKGEVPEWDATATPDPPVPGALQWIRYIIMSDEYSLAIYSCRSWMEGGIEAMKNYLLHWGLEDHFVDSIDFPIGKPIAHLYIDDRAFRFEGRFPSIPEIFNMTSWNKRG